MLRFFSPISHTPDMIQMNYHFINSMISLLLATTTEEIVSVFIEVEEHAQAMTAMFKDYQDHGQSLKAFQRPIISVSTDWQIS